MKEFFLFVQHNDKKRIFKQTIENKETLYEEIVGTAYKVLQQDCKNDKEDFYAFVKENDAYKACKKIALKDRLLTSVSESENVMFQNTSFAVFNTLETKKEAFISKVKEWIIENHPGLLNQTEQDGLDSSIEEYIQNKDFSLTHSFKFKGDYKTSRNLFKTTFTKLFQNEIALVYRKCKDLTFPNPKVFTKNDTIVKLIVEQAFLDYSASENKTIGIVDYHTNLESFLKGFEFDTKTEAEAKAKSQLDEYLEKAKEYESLSELEKAKSFYEQALLLAEGAKKQDIVWKIKSLDKKYKNKDKLNHIQVLKSKAQRAEALENVPEAIKFYTEAYDESIEIENREEQRIILKLLKPLHTKNEAVKGLKNSNEESALIEKLIISAETFLLAGNKQNAINDYVKAKQHAVNLKDKASVKKIDKAIKKINRKPVNKKPFIIFFALIGLLGLGYFALQTDFVEDIFSDTIEVNQPAYVVAGTDLNVRNGNSDKYPKLGIISRGDSVFVLEESKETKWKKIQFNNKIAWASGRLISTVLPNDINYLNKLAVVQRKIYGTTELSPSSKQIKFSKNEQIKIIFENTNLDKYRVVNSDNEYAFVSKKNIKFLDNKSSSSWGDLVESRQEGNDLCLRCGNTENMKYNCPICGGDGFYNAN